MHTYMAWIQLSLYSKDIHPPLSFVYIQSLQNMICHPVQCDLGRFRALSCSAQSGMFPFDFPAPQQCLAQYSAWLNAVPGSIQCLTQCSAWLNAVPSLLTRTQLDNNSVSQRLGLWFCELHKYYCRSTVYSFGLCLLTTSTPCCSKEDHKAWPRCCKFPFPA